MKTAKTSKRALLCSVLSIALCLSMLIGTTFAWFTDTATTSVNQIKAGNLEIELQMKDANGAWVNAEGETLPFLVEGKIPAEGTEILWEPGCTYYTPEVRVLNKGNLAVKFEYVPKALGVTGKLAEVLELVFNVPEDVDIESELLLPGETSPAWSFGYHMSEEAGNEYQNETVTGMCLTVVATQASYEKDSTDETYDENAAYPDVVTTVAGLKTALTKGGAAVVTEDLTVSEQLLVKDSSVTLDATSKTITNDKDIWADGKAYALISATGEDSSLTITGGDFIAKENDCFTIDIWNGASVTIKDGTFGGNSSCVYVGQGSLTIEGGKYYIQQLSPETHDYRFLLNCLDANYKNGTANIVVKGGTFCNFDPSSNGAEGANTNFVADGYHVEKTVKSETETWYTVVPNN